jgi:ATP-dependent DNA ligase
VEDSFVPGESEPECGPISSRISYGGYSLRTDQMPLDVAPPRSTRFGSPLVLSRVHWVQPELVAEVKYLTWTDDSLLRQVVYEGIREDKPGHEVVHPAAPLNPPP